MPRSAETQLQLLRRASQRTAKRIQGKTSPYFGFVKEYNSDGDTVLVDSHGGRRILFNPQPHLGQTAWMRAAPEGGMGSLLQTRSDSNEPEIMRWWHTDTATRLAEYRLNVENLVTGVGQLASDEAFRLLDAGEIDIASRGGSQIFLGRRPHLDMRAGIIQFTMDQDETEINQKAPVHVRRGYQNVSNEVKDEERFGVVKRPDAGSFVDQFYPDNLGNRDDARNGFAKEHLIRLTNSQPTSPTTLFDVRRGHAMDDEGQPFTLDETGLNLRTRGEYFTPASTSVLTQLDENGNFKIEHPNEATYGGLFILPAGTMRARIGVNFERLVVRNETANVGADKLSIVGNNEEIEVGANRTLQTVGNEVRSVGGDAIDVVVGQKTIVAGEILVVQVGTDNRLTLSNGNQTGFETEFLSIVAGEVQIKAPTITIDGALNVTGTIKAGGLQTNSPIVSPGGSRGRAGSIPGASPFTGPQL